MLPIISSFICGLLFAIGLGISQMTNPNKILGFLNLFGDWDPSLLVVFAAASTTYFIGYRWVVDRSITSSLEKFLSQKKIIDLRLIAGAAIFGAGWGLGGLCPGPALTDIATLKPEIILFIVSMAAGMLSAR